MKEEYYALWETLNLNTERLKGMLTTLGGLYYDAFRTQKNRPEAMDYFDFIVSEFHGMRASELMVEKKKGCKIIGTFCIYVPDEIIYALNAIPVALCGGSAGTNPDAEKMIPGNICALIKSFTGFMLAKVCTYIELSDLFVGETTCDGKKKVWELIGSDKPMYVIEIPQKKQESDRELWLKELQAFAAHMEKLTGKFLSAHTLEKAIRLVNDKRRSLSRLNSLRKEKHIPISGKDALLISQLALNDDIERFTSRVNRLADELEKRVREKTGVFPPDTPRIMVSGCPMVIPNWKVHNLIETSGGAVVAEEMCTGTRYFSDCVEEGLETVEEKIKAIAQRYMKLDCACFTPNSERIENVVRLAREYHVQGIVSYIIQECHAYNIEHEKLKMRLEKEGIPLLKIETDYTQSDTGQLKTRIEAFLEQISHAFSSKSVL